MTIETLGVDIAKNVFQLHGVNQNGHVVLKRRVMRDQLLEVLVQIDPCTVVLEACTGAFYWARKFEALGNCVIAPMRVPLASIALFLDIIHIAIGGELAVASHNAAAAKRGESEKSNETTHANLRPAHQQIVYRWTGL